MEQLPYCVNGREHNGNWHRHQTGNGFPTGNRRWVGRSYRNISSISNGRDVGWDLHTAEQAHKLLSIHGPGARGLPVDARGLGPGMGRILSRVKKRRYRLHPRAPSTATFNCIQTTPVFSTIVWILVLRPCRIFFGVNRPMRQPSLWVPGCCLSALT